MNKCSSAGTIAVLLENCMKLCKDCLRAVSNEELYEATFGPSALVSLWADEITGTTKKAEPYAPIIHSDYLPDHPFDLWTLGKRADVPVYMESTKEEGEIFIEIIFYPFGRNDFLGVAHRNFVK